MNNKKTGLLAGVLLLAWSGAVMAEVDADAAESLAKQNKCSKCHALDKKKSGPSFKETAAKYEDKLNAEQKLYTHLTTSPKVKVDGKEEEHKAVKAKNEVEIRNLVRWILSR